MNKFVVRQSLILFLTASIWGIAFVAQSVGMQFIGPYTFNAIRFLLGAVVLLPFILLRRNQNKETCKESGKFLWSRGLICGIILCVASNLQQMGILYTSVGKAGFITAMYIVLVPILGIFVGKKIGIRIWIGVALSVVGLYLLCMDGGFYLTSGDILLLFSALFFAFHILVVDASCDKLDGVKLSCIQFTVSSILSGIMMLATEHPQMHLIFAAWQPILYAGVMSCGIAYTLQVIGQRGMNPTAASLIMSFESVISAVAGFFILGQIMSGREVIGSVLMFLAIIIVQVSATSVSIGNKLREKKVA